MISWTPLIFNINILAAFNIVAHKSSKRPVVVPCTSNRMLHRIHALPVPRSSIVAHWLFHTSPNGSARLGLAREELGWNTRFIRHHYLAVELGYRERNYASSR